MSREGRISRRASNRLSPDSLEIPEILGEYRILEQIARGDHGVVFRAEPIAGGRRVALKVLAPNGGLTDDGARFSLSAAEAAALRSHPGIVSFRAAGAHDGLHYVAQELVENGRTLTDWLAERRREGFIPPGYFREVAQIATKIADALHYAHSAGVIHKAVNPSNILLTEDLEPKITGFGFARAENALALARIRGLAGAPHYLAPEQVASRRARIDHRTDVYSLGVVLYEMLTLERPFDGAANHEILKRILVREPPSPRRLSADVPRDLAVIALKAMEKEPRRRYATVADLDHDLRRYLSGDVILAKPVGRAERIFKRIRRSPARSLRDGLTAAAVFLVVVVAPWVIAQQERGKRLELEAAVSAANGDVYDAGGPAAERGPEWPGGASLSGGLSGTKRPVLLPESDENAISRAVERVLAAIMLSPDAGAGSAGAGRAKALETAAQMIDESFANEPEIEASLRLTLARASYGLGLFGAARSHLEEVVALRRTALGAQNPDTLDAVDDLAALLWEQGDLPGARALYAELVQTRTAVFGAAHGETLRSRLNLALVIREQKGEPLSEADPLKPVQPENDGRPPASGGAPGEAPRDVDSNTGRRAGMVPAALGLSETE